MRAGTQPPALVMDSQGWGSKVVCDTPPAETAESLSDNGKRRRLRTILSVEEFPTADEQINADDEPR